LSAPRARVGTFGAQLERVPHLRELLDADELVHRPSPHAARELDAVAGWARGDDAREAHAYAGAHGLPFLRVDDGFLRSRGTEAEGATPLSLLIDDVGVHDDASRPSRLELLLEEDEALTGPELVARATRLRARIVEAKLSRTNRSPANEPRLPPSDRARVLVVLDGTSDPAPSTFALALEAALDEHPAADVLVKIGAPTRGALVASIPALEDARVRVVTAPANPQLLFDHVDDVYVVDSLLGFEALLARKRVRCFGGPFYAGWGLTHDHQTFPRRRRRLPLDALVAGALIAYPRYVDPERGTRCEVERVVDHLALQRTMYEENAHRIFAFGFSRWKRTFLPGFLECPGRTPVFVKSGDEARGRGFAAGDVALVWGATAPADVERLLDEQPGRLWRMEDGFLRSVRLGAEITVPASLVVDTQGIYFDPTRPSDLEHLLETASVDDAELARARALREAIVEARISKYNVGAQRAPGVPDSARGRVVLVPGQVEDDASVRLGGVDVKTNLELLRQVRRARPDGFIIYKPHPDVWGGHRRGQVDRDEARALADLVVTDLSLPECLAVADEVHTITSLVGFEGLLREKRVFTYGRPFYAGWGLTEDRHAVARRTRRRSLDEREERRVQHAGVRPRRARAGAPRGSRSPRCPRGTAGPGRPQAPQRHEDPAQCTLSDIASCFSRDRWVRSSRDSRRSSPRSATR
jgi:capsular polysaccharide export protein